MQFERQTDGEVVATFSYAEAVVLFEVLSRWEWSGMLDGEEFWEDGAEKRVLWDLHASLEPVIDESFSASYGQTVADARSSLRDR